MSTYSDQLIRILKAVKSVLSVDKRDRTTDAYGRSLHHEGSPGSVADVLSKFGIDVNATNDRGDTLLTIALKNDESLEVIRELLDLGANVMTRDQYGRTPLHCLLRHDEPKTIIKVSRLLLDYKADVNAKDRHSLTPLHYILQHRNCTPEVVELLLQYRADVAAEDDEHSTPLMLYLGLFKEPETEIVRLLMHYKADVNAKNQRLQTPLHVFLNMWHSNPDVVELLLEHGADVKAKDSDNRTPIDDALVIDNIITANIMINYTLINEYDGDWMKMIDIKASVNNGRYAEVVAHVNQCISEIDDMKGHRINDKFSLYDWYRFVNRSLKPKPLYLTKVISKEEMYNRYPVYGSTLWTVIKQCLDRADLFNLLEEL